MFAGLNMFENFVKAANIAKAWTGKKKAIITAVIITTGCLQAFSYYICQIDIENESDETRNLQNL